MSLFMFYVDSLVLSGLVLENLTKEKKKGGNSTRQFDASLITGNYSCSLKNY